MIITIEEIRILKEQIREEIKRELLKELLTGGYEKIEQGRFFAGCGECTGTCTGNCLGNCSECCYTGCNTSCSSPSGSFWSEE